MRKATMVCGEFPDIRCGRITSAMRSDGWTHDVYTRGYPPQMVSVYDAIDWHPYRTDFSAPDSDAELFHVHGEMHHYFPVLHLKATTGKPVILNVHDLTCARPDSVLDVYEAECIEAADALVWVSEEQREYAAYAGLDVDKPYCVIPNYVSSQFFIDKTPLSHIGGLCYEGYIAPRGEVGNSRDFSPIGDAVPLHIYGGNAADLDYGIVHESVADYPLLFQHLARHDWGLAGYHSPDPGWVHSHPTKAYEYLAAGIPIISWNTPLLRPVCEMGMGIEVNSLAELKAALKQDPKPYKKAVLANRRQFTTEAVIEPLARLYEEVLA